MKSHHGVRLSLALLGLIAADSLAAKEPPTDSSPGLNIPGPETWEFTTLDDLTSKNPDLLPRLRCLDAVARQVAGEDWEHKKYHAPPKWRLWQAWWVTPKGIMGPLGWSIHPEVVKPGEVRHGITIKAYRDRHSRHRIDEIVLHAYYSAKPGQWGASLHYPYPRWGQSPHDTFRVGFSLNRPDQDKKDQKRWSVSLIQDLSRYKHRVQYDHTVYNVLVSLHDPIGSSDAEVRPWVKSAESLRQMMLRRLDRLVRKTEPAIRSGKGISAHYAIYSTNFSTSKGVWEELSGIRQSRRIGTFGPIKTLKVSLAPAPPPSYRPLTKSELEGILGHAQKEFERSRFLINEYYKEMYAALEKAFPLESCLDQQPCGREDP